MERGLEETRALAASYLKEAEAALAPLPSSTYKELLEAWRSFMLSRDM